LSESSQDVWVAGEALIDLLPGAGESIPVVGGGPANAAKALANLGVRTTFVGGISGDSYGDLIESELLSYGVDLKLARKSNLPTATAEVKLDEKGGATYKFRLEQTATFDYGDWLPIGKPKVLYTGTLATLIEPGAGALYKWVKGMEVPIVYDPNIRSSVLNDKTKYLESFSKWAETSKVVKLSLEDLEWLDLSATEILEMGPELVVLTRGDQGISAFTKDESLHQPSEKVEVVDTVGAGDTVGAVIVEGMLRDFELRSGNLEEILKRAVRAAGITCSRAGAKPPTLKELNS
jgi:fructokinase